MMLKQVKFATVLVIFLFKEKALKFYSFCYHIINKSYKLFYVFVLYLFCVHIGMIIIAEQNYYIYQN